MKNDNSSWTAAPNVTDPSQTPPFDAAVFSIPGPNSAGRHVGFVQGTGNATVETEGFMTYGGVVLHEGEAGIETLWYALPSVDAASTWSLNWNATGDDTDGKILVTLKTNPPSDGGNPNPVLAM
jgi:hypothetical protein